MEQSRTEKRNENESEWSGTERRKLIRKTGRKQGTIGTVGQE